jgi:DNA-binding transcriptional regulator YdaS (Cro superfamily)
MAPAELSAAIDALAGGNQSRFARVCGVHDRTVRSWLAGKPAIPKAIQVLVAALRRLDAAAREEIVREAGAIE